MPTKPRYKIEEAAELLGLSRAKTYERIREGRITVVKDGKHSFITAAEIERYAGQDQPDCERYKGKVPAETRA